MLNFENVRKVTDKMHQESRMYTEDFWQKVFDHIKFNTHNFVSATIEFSDEVENPIADPQKLFEMMPFYVFYCCNGRVEVEFDRNISPENLGFQLSIECLLNNHFIRHPKDEKRFVLQNVNTI